MKISERCAGCTHPIYNGVVTPGCLRYVQAVGYVASTKEEEDE
jgi:hypothetical protein